MSPASNATKWLPPEAPDGVDQEKANALIMWLIKLEAENDKTRKSSDSEMIQRIAKQIQEGVRCS